MKAVDSNILVYAHRADSAFHQAAEGAIRRLAEGKERWAIPWPCLHEFFAIATHPKIFKTATPPEIALRQIDNWLESPSLVLLGETETYWLRLKKLLDHAKVCGPLVHDARIAALCLDHAVDVLLTADRDFSRFPALETHNPLIAV
jgi:uncharacterized protein